MALTGHLIEDNKTVYDLKCYLIQYIRYFFV